MTETDVSDTTRRLGRIHIAVWVVAAAVLVSIPIMCSAQLGLFSDENLQTCSWASDEDHERIESAIAGVEVPDQLDDLGIRCDYVALLGVRTYEHSATAADAIETSLLANGWLRTTSKNRAFCLPGSPYLFAVISPFGKSTYRGEGVAAVEFHMSDSGTDEVVCPH